MKNKIIFHIDINYFFAQVEEILNPSLKNKPIAVCSNKYHGIIVSTNYIARSYGIFAPQKTYEAIKICDDLVFVKSNMFRNKQFSKKFFDCIRNNFSNEIECYSIDECYIDVTNILHKYHNNYFILANEIYKTIIKETNLKTSIGISENKFLAKTANDISDKKVFYNTLFKNELEEKLYDQNIAKIFYVGKKTNNIFLSHNIKTVRDYLNYTNSDELQAILKSKYEILNSFFKGESSDVLDIENSLNKNISFAETFLFVTSETEYIKNKIIELATQLFYKMRMQNLWAKTYTLSLRNEYKKTSSRNITISKKITNSHEFCNVFIKLLNKYWENEMINQVSVGVSKLEKDDSFIGIKQLTLFDD